MRFTRVPHPAPTSAGRRAEILTDPGFGRYFTDHMVTIRWSADRGWHDAQVGPYRPIAVDPAAAVLQYGQAIFEGLKAYRHADGAVALFRPDANATRFRASARRLLLPELPAELFLGALRELLTADEAWVPGGEASLYLRPFLVGTTPGLRIDPGGEHLFGLIATPAGSYFARGPAPVRAWVAADHVRAVPGGTGSAKCGANYAASLAAQLAAAEHGCDQVVWLDAVHRRYVEEMGMMNVFFAFADGELATPGLGGALLAGVTRDSVLQLAQTLGARPVERQISLQEWESRAADGSLVEVFAAGTAAVITPVGTVRSAAGEFTVGDGTTGPLTSRMRTALTGVQRGLAPDPHHWVRPLATL